MIVNICLVYSAARQLAYFKPTLVPGNLLLIICSLQRLIIGLFVNVMADLFSSVD